MKNILTRTCALLAVFLVFLDGQTIEISEDDYQYKYQAEYNQDIVIDLLTITETADSVNFDQNNPIKIYLDFNAIYNISDIQAGGGSNEIFQYFSFTDNVLTIQLNDTLEKNKDITFSGIKFRNDDGDVSNGHIHLRNSNNEKLSETEKKIIFTDIQLSIEPVIFPVAESGQDNLNITIRDGSEPILFAGRKLYLKIDQSLSWESGTNDFGKISIVSTDGNIVTLKCDDSFDASESVQLTIPIKSVSTPIYNQDVDISVMTTNDFYESSAQKFHYAEPQIQLQESVSNINGDHYPINGLLLNNDSSVDIFHESREFYLEISDNNGKWKSSDFTTQISGIEFTYINDNRIKGKCLNDHTNNGSIDLSNLKVYMDANGTFSFALLFPNSDYYDETENELKVFTPEFISKNHNNRFITNDPKSRRVTEISISNTTPTIFRDERSIKLVLPNGFKWDQNNLPYASHNSVNVSFISDDSIKVDFTGDISTDSLMLSNGKIFVDANEAQTDEIELIWDHNEEIYETSEELILIDPQNVSFDQSSWIINDGLRSLGDIRIEFSSNGRSVFRSGYYFYLKIPDTSDCDFTSLDTDNIDAPWASEITNNNKIIKFKLRNSTSDNFTLTGIEVNIGTDTETTPLELALLDQDSFDSQDWASNTKIRVKRPLVQLASENVILCMRTNYISNISLTQNDNIDQSIYNNLRTLRLILPSGMIWSSVSVSGANKTLNQDTLTLYNFNGSVSKELYDIKITTKNISNISPQKIKLIFDNNNTVFLTDKKVRAGTLITDQQDTSFIVNDKISTLPELEINQSQSLLIPGYSLVLLSLDELEFPGSNSPISSSSDIDYSRLNTSELQFTMEDEISNSKINISHNTVGNISTTANNRFVWYFQKDGYPGISIDTFYAKVGEISFDYIDGTSSEFRYPTYIINDPYPRKFPAVVIKDTDNKGIFRNNREIKLILREGIKWYNTPDHIDNINFKISSDDSIVITFVADIDKDSVVIQGNRVHNFTKSFDGYSLNCFVSNNQYNQLGTLNIRIVEPKIKFSNEYETQTFWLNSNGSQSQWRLRELQFLSPKENGLIPLENFGVRLKFPRSDSLTITNSASTNIKYGSQNLNYSISNSILRVYGFSLNNWDDKTFIVDSLFVNAENKFRNGKIQFSLTEYPYYWIDCDLSLFVENPSFVTGPECKAYLVGDSIEILPSFKIDNLGHIPINDEKISEIFIKLPQGFPAAWLDTNKIIAGKYRYDNFDNNIIDNTYTISGIGIKNIDSIYASQPLVIQSGEGEYAQDEKSATRKAEIGKIKVGNPKCYFNGQSPDDELSNYTFCYNDPITTLPSIIIEEDKVAALLAGDTIFIKILDGYSFPASLGETITTGLGGISYREESKVIQIILTDSLQANQIYGIKGLKLSDFKNRTTKSYNLNVYYRDPKRKEHPYDPLAKLQIGKPEISFLESANNRAYYVSNSDSVFFLNRAIEIREDPNFPVMDNEGIFLILEKMNGASFSWNGEKDSSFIWMQGNGIQHLENNRIHIKGVRLDSMLLNLESTLGKNQRLEFKPFYFSADGDGAVRIMISNNKGNSYLDTCIIYKSDPKFYFEDENDQRILKTVENKILPEMYLNNVYGLNDLIYISIPKSLNCIWAEAFLNEISIKNRANIDIDGNIEKISPKILQIELTETNSFQKDSLLLKNLPISFSGEAASSFGFLEIIWDDYYTRKLSEICEHQIILGAPEIKLKKNIVLIKDIDSVYYLPAFHLKDDPLSQIEFLNHKNTVGISLPNSDSLDKWLAFEHNQNDSLYFIHNGDTISRITPFIYNTNTAVKFEFLDSTKILEEGLPKPINLEVRGLKLRIKKQEALAPFHLEYFYQQNVSAEVEKLGKEKKNIRIADPEIEFDGDPDIYINSNGVANFCNNIIWIKENQVPAMLNDQQIAIRIRSKLDRNVRYNWFIQNLGPGLQKEHYIGDTLWIKINNDDQSGFKANDSSYIKNIFWQKSFNEILSLGNELYNLFPDTVSVSVNFRPDEKQAAWVVAKNYRRVHLPLFIDPPQFDHNELKFSTVTNYFKDTTNHLFNIINFRTINTPSCQLQVLCDKLGITPHINSRVNLEEPMETNFSYIFNDTAIFEINQFFGNYAKQYELNERLYLGIDRNIKQPVLQNEDTTYYNWYFDTIQFYGYTPYDTADIKESSWAFNESAPYELNINFSDACTLHSVLTALGNSEIIFDTTFNSELFIFQDTVLKYFSEDDLYLLKVTGQSLKGNIFPIYRYLLFDNLTPQIDSVDITPKSIENHAKRNDKFNYDGLSVSPHDSLKIVVKDNFITDGSGLFFNHTQDDTIKLPYNYELHDKLRLETFYNNYKDSTYSLELVLPGILNHPNCYNLIDCKETNNLIFSFSDIVSDTKDKNLTIALTITDFAGNNFTDTLYYHLLTKKGQGKLISKHIFNYPNPFNVSEGTTFRYVLTADASSKKGVLAIFDGGGDIVFYRKLKDNELKPGIQKIKWDGCSLYGEKLPTGIYFGYFRIGNQEESHLKIAIDNRE